MNTLKIDGDTIYNRDGVYIESIKDFEDWMENSGHFSARYISGPVTTVGEDVVVEFDDPMGHRKRRIALNKKRLNSYFEHIDKRKYEKIIGN